MDRPLWPAPDREVGHSPNGDGGPSDDARFWGGLALTGLAYGAMGVAGAIVWHLLWEGFGGGRRREEDYREFTVIVLGLTAGILATTAVGLIACSKRSGVARAVAAAPAALLLLGLLWLVARRLVSI